MSTPADPFTLARWRRSVAALYAAVREDTPDRAAQAARFRADRDALFRDDVQSPIAEARRKEHPGVPYYPYDPAWRVSGRIAPLVTRETFALDLATDGTLRCTKVGRATFATPRGEGALSMYWIEGYGGGLWLPFADATSGRGTYGGGRYLYDTIKGADLGVDGSTIVLDFNYAYNPSCAYDEAWSCPLTPSENRLPFAVEAGERVR